MSPTSPTRPTRPTRPTSPSVAASPPRQLVDWRAALWAGLGAGTAFLLLWLFWVPAQVGGNPWVTLRLLASVVLGAEVLAPPATFDAAALGVGLLVHYALSLGFAALLAYVLHRGGIVLGVVGGTAFGLALYAISFYTATLAFPWFFAHRSLPLLLAHALFGALAGGLYELLEVETFDKVAAAGEVTP